MKMRWIPLPVFPLLCAFAFALPASAGDGDHKVTFFSDRRGDAGWVETEAVSGRMRATPYFRISGETVRRAEDTAGRAAEVRASVAEDLPETDGAEATDRKTRRKEVLSSLLTGPEGVSLGKVLDLARQASESARSAFRQARDGRDPRPRPAGSP